MLHRLPVVISILFVSLQAGAANVPFSPALQEMEVTAGDATLHVRVGGQGPAVVLLHGFGDTGDMWAPLAAELAHDHTVVVPDLRGMGLSSHPAGRLRQEEPGAATSPAFSTRSNIEQGRSRDARHRQHGRLCLRRRISGTRHPAGSLMDAPLPGIGPWDEIIKSPLLWHFNFRGPDVERLVEGRERIYLDRFWNEFSADPKTIDEATRGHYAALYARPGAMHSRASSNSPLSRRTPSTTRPSLAKAS